eukprot:XP_011601842.1 PREDICTED: uncharacterized protein KIAA1467 homolog [Takifugu rubripes]
MAAALSRALKLPGKKGPDLGEYDPLTQADSEDESEEDDLVLNYPRNGLGRDSRPGSGSSKLLGSRSGRHVGARGEAPDDEEEEDEWRERQPGKGKQYWGHRHSGRDRAGDDGGGPGPLGGTGVAVHGTDAEEKRKRTKRALRSALFLVPLFCAALTVLLSAFLIPCQNAKLQSRRQWEQALGAAGGIASPPLALWDVDGDSMQDMILGVTEETNDTHPTQGNKVYSVVALSAAGGHVLWRKVMPAPVIYIQSGLQYPSQLSPVVLLISRSTITAINGTTGKTLWPVLLKDIESQAVLLPDLEGDSVPDLLVATLPADKASDLSLSMISGLTGMKLGRPLSFNVTAQGKLIGPLLHETQQGAYYILFGLGNIEAISLCDIYLGATGQKPVSQSLWRKDPVLEGLKKSNSSFININRGVQPVDLMFPLVAGFGNSHNSLDVVSNLNSSRSDWVLVYTTRKLSVLKHKDMRKEWTFNAGPIHSQPAPGHFNDDGVLDLFIQSSANGIMKAQVVDGASGRLLWEAEFVCPRVRLDASAVATSAGQSAVLFWASEPIRAQKSVSKATVAPGVAEGEPLIRKLFLFYPAYPTILVELMNTTDTAVSSAVSYQDRQKDATYMVVSLRPTPESRPGAWMVTSMSLRAAVAKGRLVRLQESNKTGQLVQADEFEANRFFRRLTFKHQ